MRAKNSISGSHYQIEVLGSQKHVILWSRLSGPHSTRERWEGYSLKPSTEAHSCTSNMNCEGMFTES